MLLAAVAPFTFAGCDRGKTLHTFKFKGAMKAGDLVQESDLEPISIPWSGDATVTVVGADGETQSVEEIDFDIWVTKDELGEFIGKKLVEDVEAGDQLLDKMLE